MSGQVDQKLQQQAHQLFNLSENVIMHFIAKFLDEVPSIIFKENIPEHIEPLILMPFDEYKNDKYLKFTLNVIKNKKFGSVKRVESINNIIQHQNVKDAMGFLLYSIKSVLPSIVSSSMINNKPMLNINLELDGDSWVFCPVFENEIFIKRKFFEGTIQKIQIIKQNEAAYNELTDEKRNDLIQQYNNAVKSLNELVITDDIIESDKKINELYLDQYCIAINVCEITKDKLPKPRVNSNQILPVISSKSYEDAT
jgi:hypothetical protein